MSALVSVVRTRSGAGAAANGVRSAGGIDAAASGVRSAGGVGAADAAWMRVIDARYDELVGEERVGVTAEADRARLRRAYRHCAQLTRRHHPAVYAASLLLSKDKRRALQALTAFLWHSDNLSEASGAKARRSWRAWCDAVLAERVPEDDDILVAFADTRVRFGIPHAWIAKELQGLDGDHRPPEHEELDELIGYCFDVLAPAALIMLRVFGVEGAEVERYSVRFAVAVQLTDMLCDIGDDLAAGRVYLPARELAAHGIEIRDVAAGTVSAPWRVFLQRMVARNEQLYRSAAPTITMLPLGAALSTHVMGALYEAQLRQIAEHDYDVFRHPPRLSWRHLLTAASSSIDVVRTRWQRARARS